ncbi:MAG: signal peptidase II [Candidatus Humimicrobiaceae bacterium]
MKKISRKLIINLLFFISAVIIIAVDRYTKQWIMQNLPENNSIDLIPGVLLITHVKNSGASFGLFQGYANILAIISVIAIILIIFIKIYLKFDSYFYNIALGFILGGAIGNLIDRVVYGEVVDFLNLVYWPVFNIADSFIIIGFGIVIIFLFKEFFKKSGAKST